MPSTKIVQSGVILCYCTMSDDLTVLMRILWVLGFQIQLEFQLNQKMVPKRMYETLSSAS